MARYGMQDVRKEIGRSSEPLVLIKYAQQGNQTVAVCGLWTGGINGPALRLGEVTITEAECNELLRLCEKRNIFPPPHLEFIERNWGTNFAAKTSKRIKSSSENRKRKSRERRMAFVAQQFARTARRPFQPV